MLCGTVRYLARSWINPSIQYYRSFLAQILAWHLEFKQSITVWLSKLYSFAYYSCIESGPKKNLLNIAKARLSSSLIRFHQTTLPISLSLIISFLSLSSTFHLKQKWICVRSPALILQFTLKFSAIYDLYCWFCTVLRVFKNSPCFSLDFGVAESRIDVNAWHDVYIVGSENV